MVFTRNIKLLNISQFDENDNWTDMSLEGTSLIDDKEEQLEERVNVSSWFYFKKSW